MSVSAQLPTTLARRHIISGLTTIVVSLFVRPALAQPVSNGSLPLPLTPGVVVEEVTPNAAGAKLGFKRGDVLLLWRCGDSKLKLESPFDFSRVERHSLACTGLSQFEGLRGADRHIWALGQDYWEITVQPNFIGRLQLKYDEGVSLFTKRIFSAAQDCWLELGSQAEPSWLQPWLALRAADLFAEAKLWPEADSNYQRSVDLAGRTGPVVLAEILYAWGEAYWRRSEFEQAEQRYRRALAEAERDGDNLYIAKMLNSLGSAALNQGNLDDADRCFQRNAAIYQAFGPSLNLAANFAELGTVALYRGDLATAEAYYQRDLALTEKLAPGSPDLAITYNNFGMLLERRKDSARAQQYLQKALSIARLVDPTGIRTGTVLGNLGSVMRDAGQLTRSEICYRRALRMKLRSAPNSLTLADTLGNLGDLAYITGRMAVAERYFKDALTIQQRLAPSGLAIASTLNGLGDIARTAGKTNTALEYYEHAVSIRHTLAPGSKAEAESLASLARLAKYGGQPERATELYEQAVAALDAQTQHLGGGDQVRSDFRAQYVPYYKELAELRVKQRDPTGALEVLERSRARSLLETLAQGNVEIKNGTDPLLRRRESALTQALGAKASYRIRLLTGLHTDDQLDAVNKDIAHIVTELAAVRERLRLDSPAYAILTQAVPLHITEIRKLLDEDTVLLEYSLGSDRSYLWLVTPTSVSVHPLASGPTIEALCRQFYDFLKNRDGWTGDDIRTQERVQSVGVRLSRILLGPVASQIRNKRLLIVGDGALHYIPFSVLPAPNRTFDSGSAQTPLIVEHEIVNLPSASVLDSLRRAQVGRRRPPGEVAVLADAVFSARDQRVIDGNERARKSANAGSLGEDRGLLSRAMRDVGLDRAVSLPRLPFSRHEASLILRVSPASAQMSAMDFKASRATAISDELSQYRIVHFATHAVLDNVHPELSGLVLSLVDEHGNPQNGFLGLEDIYNLRLRADLVVLSACHTGLGKLVNGEGLVGLTRGFMYAGAHRIVSSFWAVDDRGTAELMGRFYQAMERDGMRPAAALRRAQTEMLAQRQWRSPYYWGGFQILGEWN